MNTETVSPAIRHRFTIDESRWIHGSVPGKANDSQLLVPSSGKMCCLGFFALSCGVPEDAISGVGEPNQINEDKTTPLFRDLIENQDFDSELTDLRLTTVAALITANDEAGMDLKERKDRVSLLFARLDVEVTFEPGTPEAANL